MVEETSAHSANSAARRLKKQSVESEVEFTEKRTELSEYWEEEIRK